MPTWLRTIGLAAVVGALLGTGLGFFRSTVLPAELGVVDVGALEPLAVQRPVTEKESGMPAYESAELTPFADQMTVQGAAMATGWFLAPDPIEDVQVFYERRLAEMGAPIQSKRFPNGLGYVAYKEAGTDLMHTATLVPQGEKSTMVFVSTSSARDVMAGMNSSKVPSELPHPEGAESSAVLSAGVGAVNQRWVTATVPGQGLSEVLEFYQKAFVERGWRLSGLSVDERKENAFLRARKGSLEAQVSLKHDPVDNKSGTQLFVLLTDKRKADAPAAVATK